MNLGFVARLAALERRQPPPSPDAGEGCPPFDYDAYQAAWEELVASAPDRADLIEQMAAAFAAGVDEWRRPCP